MVHTNDVNSGVAASMVALAYKVKLWIHESKHQGDQNWLLGLVNICKYVRFMFCQVKMVQVAGIDASSLVLLKSIFLLLSGLCLRSPISSSFI